jgi:hypothetical protein
MSQVVNVGADPDLATVSHLIELIRAEVDALEAVLPDAIAVQCMPSPVPRPREDTVEREKNRRSNPTLDTVLDERRLRLSQQVLRSRRLLRNAVIAARGVRRGLEISLVAWHGEQEDENATACVSGR